MIVDDEPLVRASIQSFLNWEEHGFTFSCEASDGRDALFQLRNNTVDLILLDIQMPVMDGLEFLRELEKWENPPHVIVLSANDNYSYVREAFQLRALDYILKSDLDETTLLDLLNRKKDEISPSGISTSALNTKDLNYLKQRLLMDLFENRNPEITLPVLADLGIRIQPPIRLCYMWGNETIQETQREMLKLQASQFLKKREMTVTFFLTEKGEFFFLISVEKGLESAINTCESFCRDFLEIIQNGMDISLDYAISCQCETLQDIPGQYSYVRSLPAIESRIIRKAKKFIKKNFASSTLSLEEVSSFVEVSKPHLSSQFHKETGITFRDYVTKVRVDQAKELLLATNLKVYEISENVGYPNVEHFSRIFKKATGMTPNRYASQGKN